MIIYGRSAPVSFFKRIDALFLLAGQAPISETFDVPGGSKEVHVRPPTDATVNSQNKDHVLRPTLVVLVLLAMEEGGGALGLHRVGSSLHLGRLHLRGCEEARGQV